ncbi:hypothetical protein PRZ48_003514 [Zasmidium cellare]|uniref:Enoyl reductase (ER) domain-containing protein n=1 Tax=Zasmidium cellare TaxID=395010 RepID=A0ABR0EWT8_ZASCE|nr:hypothetical protein PRZ48_003514 [Zasmidium cellare]
MKALRATKPNPTSPPTLTITDVPIPTPSPSELLIKIHASAIQPADILNSKGSFPHTTFPRTLGKDFSGVVIEGPSSWKGKAVFGTSGDSFSFTVDGANADYAVVPVDAVAEKPESLSFAQAASLGTPLSTAALTLQRANVQEGDFVMVLGATGSVGSFVMQIAKAKGCKTISVGRHGTDVNSTTDPTLQRAKTFTNDKGPDVVVDTVGDFALTKAAFDVLAFNGRMCFITAPRGGATTELGVDILSLYRRQVSLVGCNSAGLSQEAMGSLLRELGPELESGALKAPGEETLGIVRLERAVEAYEGKVKKAVIVFD